MPLKIVDQGKYERPVIVCDHCGKAITDVRDGNYQWKAAKDGKLTDDPVYFTHKDCCHAFDQANPGMYGAMNLDCLFVYLANSLKLDWKAARERVAMLDSIE
jgi:hypothetical protein